MYSKLARGQILRSTLIVVPAGVALFAGRLYWNGDEALFSKVIMPAVFKTVDPEYAHWLAVVQAKYRLYPPAGDMHKEYATLRTTVFGTDFTSPLGLAAGFDKDCGALAGLSAAGFGFVETGTVTALPQEGNRKPRVFRLVEDEAVINRYGFNNVGIGRFANNLARQQAACGRTVVGVNIGKNKDTPPEDAQFNYASLTHYVGDKCNYVVVNVSSPNTAGLRDLQAGKSLARILTEVRASRSRLQLNADAGSGPSSSQVDESDAAFRRGRKPPAILVKLAPDLTDNELADICKVCMDKKHRVDGIIMGNTTVQRMRSLQSLYKTEKGGLSGRPLRDMSTDMIAKVYKLTNGSVPIVGCGGVFTGADAYEKIRAGASLVQVYTALVYRGWPVVGAIKRELHELLVSDGYDNVGQAVGADHINSRK